MASDQAAIYARYSSDNQREESIEAQVLAIKEYCNREGIKVVSTYVDEARSATTDDRPEFLRMIKDSQAGLWNLVIVHKLDRFARNRYDSAFYKRELRRAGVRLVSVTEQLDGSPESIILESVLEGMAEYYSRNLAREVMKGMKVNARKAKFCGGTPPLGYDIVDGNYVINETEAPWVRLIFDMYTAGRTYKQIIDALNERGAKTKRNRPFGKNSIHSILKNERYSGVYIYNKGTKKRHNIEKKDVIKVEDGIPAITSLDTWKKAQARLKSRRQGANSAKRTFLLTGHVVCGRCGGAMTGNSYMAKGKEYSYYRCARKKRNFQCDMPDVPQDALENLVLKSLSQIVFNETLMDRIANLVNEYAETQNQGQAEEISYLKQELQEAQKKINNLVDFVAQGLGNRDVHEKLKTKGERRDMLMNRLRELETKQQIPITKDMIKHYLSRYATALTEKKNADDLKEVIDALIDTIIVHPESDAEINFRFFGAEVSTSNGSGEGI